jgi:hypothetical protein
LQYGIFNANLDPFCLLMPPRLCASKEIFLGNSMSASDGKASQRSFLKIYVVFLTDKTENIESVGF